MKKTLKIVGWIFGSLLVLLVGLAVVLNFYLGEIIQKSAISLGPKYLGVPIEIVKSNVSLARGLIYFEGIQVGNPDGYSKDPLMKLARLRFELDVSSLFSTGPIIIKDILVDSPFISYESVKSKTNVQAIQDRLTGGAKEVPQPKVEEPKPAPEKSAKSKAPGRKVIIRHFQLVSGQVNYRNSTWTLGQAIPLPLPTITLENIGEQSGGATVMDATGEIFSSIFNGITDAVGSAAGSIGKGLSGTTDAAGKTASDTVKSIKNLFK